MAAGHRSFLSFPRRRHNRALDRCLWLLTLLVGCPSLVPAQAYLPTLVSTRDASAAPLMAERDHDNRWDWRLS